MPRFTTHNGFSMFPQWLLLGLAFIGAGVHAAVAADSGTAVPLKQYAGLLRTVEVRVAGKPTTMLFDTGAGVTLITPQFARQIGCEPRGHLSAFRMNGERIAMQHCPPQSLAIGHYRVTKPLAVFDLKAVLPADLPPIEGVLGLDALDGQVVTILHGLSALRVERPEASRSRARSPSSGRLRIAREAAGQGLTVFVPIVAGDQTAWMLVDSANLAGIRLHPESYRLLSQIPRQDSAARGDVALVFAVDGARPARRNVELLPDLIYDGALDAEFLSHYDLTLDLVRERASWRFVD